MNPGIFEFIKDEHLSKPLRVLKWAGKICMMISLMGIAIVQLNNGTMGNSSILDYFIRFTGWGLIAGILCFAFLGLISVGKTANNTSLQAIVHTLKKIFLYIFLPAIVITIFLTAVYILPRYQ